jgi:branched-chain amino acid transport system ATP-binding protein
MMSRSLSIQNVSKRFGSVVACDHVTTEIKSGTCTAIVGPNGAGKSTLLNIVCGEILADEGLVYWEGAALVGLRPQQIARLGVARMFQDLRLFDALSAYENLLVAAQLTEAERRKGNPAFLKDPRPGKELALEALEQLGLRGHANRKVSDLSYAERKLVALGRVMVSRAGIALLDEPASGLDGRSLLITLRQVETMLAAGVVMLIVEHNLSLVRKMASRAILIETGRIVADGAPEEVFAASDFGRVYFSLQPQKADA